MALAEIERRWLDYAWRVITCPDEHREACIAVGGAVPGPGRVDGNELRWPGYLGVRYQENRGVLCVGAVHREADPDDPVHAELLRSPDLLVESARAWLRRGRSEESDTAYLHAVRRAYEEQLPRWSRWQRHFRTIVTDYLGLGVKDIAWANIAKCRVALHLGAKQRRAEADLTRLCEREFVPMCDLVEAIRPAAVFVAVLHAGRGGEIVASWDSEHARPLVFAWQGQSGHDRHNTAPGARPLNVWAPEAAQRLRQRWLAMPQD